MKIGRLEMEDSDMETTTGEDTISVTEFKNEGENEDSYSDDKTFETNITEGGETVDCTMFRGKPYKGLTFEDLKDVRFDTIEEADKFYLMYSVAKGFSMRKHKLDWNRPKTYVARRELGNPDKRVRTSLGVDNDTSVGTYDVEKKVCSRTRRISRRKCPARLTVIYCPQSGAYYASAFITAHNHRLARHEHRQFLRSNQKVADHDLAQVISLRKVSVGTARAYKFLVHQAGGYEFVGFMLRDLQNRIQTHHADILMDGDAQSSSFRDYNLFGDILIFDSRYKTNIYGKPLAVFVGTNNHRATVMFGCALLVDEMEETYDWVLRVLLSSMKDKKPISVISDSDNAIRNAVDNLILGARHRLCAWHIGKNVCSHLNDDDTR
ncbi:protein FAR1-RELATED SEQUENCE 5-like [Rosa rugosa]|uniref:protein FAR1-RELATED SEQUENCE 5-like n=1 Tax=Rosa rugosa TaxID=74645 RepID=UPI002B417453|nr:protein FAR1-RELATED SEQUENCE 5-like [Rosa rugosa]